METALKSYEILNEMAEHGNAASISDVGVGLLATRGCIGGAGMNVRINLGSLKDEKVKSSMQKALLQITAESEQKCDRIIQIVQGKLD